jgi:hypothetical protein
MGTCFKLTRKKVKDRCMPIIDTLSALYQMKSFLSSCGAWRLIIIIEEDLNYYCHHHHRRRRRRRRGI